MQSRKPSGLRMHFCLTLQASHIIMVLSIILLKSTVKLGFAVYMEYHFWGGQVPFWWEGLPLSRLANKFYCRTLWRSSSVIFFCFKSNMCFFLLDLSLSLGSFMLLLASGLLTTPLSLPTYSMFLYVDYWVFKIWEVESSQKYLLLEGFIMQFLTIGSLPSTF